MTTITEADFMHQVEADLHRRFGPEDVIREPQLPSGRIPDFICNGPLAAWCVEVENETDDLATGVGQAIMYANEYGDDRDAQPVVYLPTPVDDFAEYRAAQNAVRVITLDPTDPQS